MASALCASISRACSAFVPSSRTTTGTATPTCLHGDHHALGDQVAADDAAKDVHEDRAHLGIGKNELERRRHSFGGRATAHVEEVRRIAAVQLDEIHGRHGEARAVHHAGDVAIERDVVEVVFARRALDRIFLRRIAQARQRLLTENRIRVDVDLRVERDEVATLGDDQRIDLEQRRVALEVNAVQRHENRLELANLRALEAEPEGDLAALIALQARGRIDVDTQDLLGRVRRDFLDVHAAGGGGDDRDAAALAIQRERQIDFALDLRTRLDVDDFDRQAFRPGLFRDQSLTEHVGGCGAHGIEIAREFHTARLATAAGVHLGFDHPELAA